MTIQPQQFFTGVGLMTAPREERAKGGPQVCSAVLRSGSCGPRTGLASAPRQVLPASPLHRVVGRTPTKFGFWLRLGTSQAPAARFKNPSSFWDYTRVKA